MCVSLFTVLFYPNLTYNHTKTQTQTQTYTNTGGVTLHFIFDVGLYHVDLFGVC